MDFTRIGYCCNVHPGKTLDEVRRSLIEHALAVKKLTSNDQPLGVGLWLSATTARQLTHAKLRLEFRDWLQEVGLTPYTLNGFPYGDFHQSVVKHQVYQPTWAEDSRLEYTLQLSSILHDLLPPGAHGSISTLPLGWPRAEGSDDRSFFRRCAENLKKLVGELAELRSQTGRLIIVCLEPEPGCILDSADDLVRFFVDYLSPRARDQADIRAHLGVCHDICHSAVMFEEQLPAIQAYRAANLTIGKVQVSSAVSIDFDRLTTPERELALAQLEQFVEPRYLHQTVWKIARHQAGDRHPNQTHFFEDLPLAISQIRRAEPRGEMRVHFHVPIFADRLGLLSTTQPEIGDCLKSIRAAASDEALIHFEIETYAWNVLPVAWRPKSLAEGIALELNWLRMHFDI